MRLSFVTLFVFTQLLNLLQSYAAGDTNSLLLDTKQGAFIFEDSGLPLQQNAVLSIYHQLKPTVLQSVIKDYNAGAGDYLSTSFTHEIDSARQSAFESIKAIYGDNKSIDMRYGDDEIKKQFPGMTADTLKKMRGLVTSETQRYKDKLQETSSKGKVSSVKEKVSSVKEKVSTWVNDVPKSYKVCGATAVALVATTLAGCAIIKKYYSKT